MTHKLTSAIRIRVKTVDLVLIEWPHTNALALLVLLVTSTCYILVFFLHDVMPLLYDFVMFFSVARLTRTSALRVRVNSAHVTTVLISILVPVNPATQVCCVCNDTVLPQYCKCFSISGVNCNTEINECSSNPCFNGGTCQDQVGSFQCVCQAGECFLSRWFLSWFQDEFQPSTKNS